MIAGLLKSSGRVICQGLEMYYQLYLHDQRYLLKYYDDEGKQRVARPLNLPAQNIEIHVIGEHLVAYHKEKDSHQKGQIIFLQLSNLRATSYSLRFELQASGQEIKIINQLYRAQGYNYIIFSDSQNNVYLLNWSDGGELACKLILRHEHDIKRISVNENDEIVLIGQNGAYTASLDWDNVKFDNEEVINVLDQHLNQNIIDYFRSQKYVVHYTKLRKWQKPTERVLMASQQQVMHQQIGSYYLLIDEAGKIEQQAYEGKYSYEFSKGQLIFFAGKQWLLIFNKEENIIVTLFNNLQNVTKIEDNLMSKLEPNNFVASFKTDSNFHVLLEIRIFGLTNFPTLHTYEMNVKNESEHKVYLKTNLHLMFNINGLPSPDFQKEARKSLTAFLNTFEYKSSAQSRVSHDLQEENPTLNAEQLGRELIRCGLVHFPRSLDRLARKLRWSVFYNKNIGYIRKSHRYFEYCQDILHQIENTLNTISKNQQAAIDNDEKILQSRDQEELRKIKQLLENMIEFLSMILLALSEEMKDSFKLERKAQPERQLEKIMQGYQNVLNSAKSSYLVCRLLDDENNAKRCEQCFRDLKKKEFDLKQIWEVKMTSNIKQYKPIMVQQHFWQFEGIRDENSIRLPDLISFILANKTSFLENAYFFQAVNRQAFTPYLQSDLYDLIENMLYHLKLEKTKDSRDLLVKMVGTVLRIKISSFTRFLIQQCIFQQQYKLAILLLTSKTLLQSSQNDQTRYDEKVFTIQSFILARKVDYAHIFLLENYEEGLVEVLVRAGKECGYSAELVEIINNSFLPLIDRGKIQEILDIEKQKWSLIDKK